MTEEYDQQFFVHDLVRVKPSSRVGDSSHQHWGRAIYLGRRGDKACIKPLGGHKRVEMVPFSDIKLWKSKSGESAQAERLSIQSNLQSYFAGKNKGWTDKPEDAAVYLTSTDARRALGKVSAKYRHLQPSIIPAPESAASLDKAIAADQPTREEMIEEQLTQKEKEQMQAQQDPVVGGFVPSPTDIQPSKPFEGINDEDRPYEPLKIEKPADFLTITAEIENLQRRMKDDYQMMLEAKKSLLASIAKIRELNAIQAKLLESDDIFK